MLEVRDLVLFMGKKYVILDKWKDGSGTYRYEIIKSHNGKPKKTTLTWSVSETRLTPVERKAV